MKLKLHNFKYFTDAEFDLPDTGLVLLSGDSGHGKTTVLKAILYALYGTKAVKKPYTFGTTTCSVRLEFMDLQIYRSNRPNRLLVGDLEDAEAQAFINAKLGMNFEEFLISSYISQKNGASVLSANQTEQLNVIRTLAIDDEQKNTAYKEKLKKMVQESSRLVLEKKNKMELLKEQVERLKENTTPIQFPLTLKTDETKDKAIDKYKKRIREYNDRITKLTDQRHALHQNLTNHNSCESELRLINEQITAIEDNLDTGKKAELEKLLENVPSDLKDQIKIIKLSIQYSECQEELNKLEAQYTEIKTAEDLDRKQQVSELKSNLWIDKDYKTSTTKLEKYREKILLWNQYQQATKKLAIYSEIVSSSGSDSSRKQELIDHYSNLLKGLAVKQTELNKEKERLLLEQKIISCPSCKAALCWQKDTLVEVASGSHRKQNIDYPAELKRITSELANVNNTIIKSQETRDKINSVTFPPIDIINPDYYEEIKVKMEHLRDYISTNKGVEAKLKGIEKDSQSPALKKLQTLMNAKISILEKLVEQLPDTDTDTDTNADADLITLRTKFHNLSEQLTHYNKYEQELKELNIKITTRDKKIANARQQRKQLMKKIAENDPKEYKKQIEIINLELKSIKEKQESDMALQGHVEQYEKYVLQKKEYQHWNQQLTEITKELQKLERMHNARVTLKERYAHAEILALEHIITSINEHTKYYLDTFFSEHPLCAELEASYTGKKIQSFKINTVINYKGYPYDSIKELSGGEFDRCTLSSVCGINSMLGSTILILDESLASLDTDNNTEIIRFLGDLAEDKLILVCSHEAVKGIFDDIIEFNN